MSPRRFLIDLAHPLTRSLVVGGLAGMVGIVCSALVPLAIGLAIDRGIIPRNTGSTLVWALAILVLILIRAGATVVQERRDVAVTVRSSYRTMELVNEHAAHLGSSLRHRISTGDLVSIGVGDITPIGRALSSTSRGAGAVVSIVVVAVIMLISALPLGLIVLVGVPVIVWLISQVLRPLRARQRDLRQLQGELTGVAVDIASGLRIIAGLGAQRNFGDQYHELSQKTRRFATLTARYEAVTSSCRVLLSGVLTTVVVWVGARQVLDGHLSPGQLVAFYGYAVFLVTPLRWLTDTAEFLNRGWVSIERVTGFLNVTPTFVSEGTHALPDSIELLDACSGVRVEHGRFSVVVCRSEREGGEIAQRLAGPGASAFIAGRPAGEYDVEDLRRRVLLVPSEDYLFAGPLGETLDPFGRVGVDAIERYARTASVDDVIAALEDALDTQVRAGGSSFSGGERQRLRLLRALLAEPDVLVLIEPTSSLDATTESHVAERLKAARAGLTTVVFSRSPLMIGHAEHVTVVEDGKVTVTGTPAQMHDHVEYQHILARSEELL